MKRLSAVLLAAGESRRFRASSAISENKESGFRSKTLVECQGRPLFLHSLTSLVEHLPVGELVLVVRPEDREVFERAIEACVLPSPTQIRLTSGGLTRKDSVRLGLESLSHTEKVAIHDSARPHLSPSLLSRLWRAAIEHPAVIPVLPIFDTIKEVSNESQILKTLDRRRLVRVQTPQIFDFDLILKAHRELAQSTLEFTDDSMLLEHLGVPVYTCEGDEQNQKITVQQDLEKKEGHS